MITASYLGADSIHISTSSEDAATLVKQFGGRRCYGPSYSDLLAARVCGDGCCLILTRVYESWEVQGGRYLVFYVGGLEEAARGTLSEDVNF